MSQNFRIRFTLKGSTTINSPQRQMALAERSVDEEDVVLRGLNEALIQDSTHLVVEGREYGTEEEARAAGERWRGVLERSFAAVNLGADFGDRSPTGVLTHFGARMYEAQLGRPVLNDQPGVMTFKAEPRPRFLSMSATPSVGRSAAAVVKTIRRAHELQVTMSEDERLAYDLYSASFASLEADARYVMLMMAVETLLEPTPRTDDVQAHVAHLIAMTEQADIPEEEKSSVVGSLKWLTYESISRTGRRLAGTLGDRKYMDQTPVKFFTSCYEVRSRLVHGSKPRPSFVDVNARCVPLERFVSDLLAGDLRDG